MIQREIRSWIRDFAASVPHRDAVTLAHDVVMLHLAFWPDKAECEMFEFEAWLRTHQSMYARGVIRVLKKHRKWSAVKRLLISNQDPFYGGTIAASEYHPHLLRVIRKYG